MPVTVREYLESDLPFVERSYAEYLEEERRRVPQLGLPDDFAATYLPRLLAKVRDEGGLFLVAVDEELRVGYAAALPKEPQAWDQTRAKVVMIMDLYVVPGRRRSGIGRALFDAIEQRYAAEGFEWVTLGMMANNESARAFYEARGYRPTYLFLGKSLHPRR